MHIDEIALLNTKKLDEKKSLGFISNHPRVPRKEPQLCSDRSLKIQLFTFECLHTLFTFFRQEKEKCKL